MPSEPRPAVLNGIAPFFIVDDLRISLEFYRSKLGFEIVYTGGGDENEDDYFGIVRRGGAMLMLKSIGPGIHPQPNHSRHEWARWDAYIDTPDPDALFQEYVGRAVPMHRELSDTGDGLRAFEVVDNSGYVLCFGFPRKDGTAPLRSTRM